MIITVYLDESGTHAGSVATVLGAIMGNAQQWRRAERQIEKVKKRHDFTVFHAKEFRAQRGEFEGWSKEKCLRCLDDLRDATGDLMEAVTCSLPNAVYDEHYRSGQRPKKLRLDTRYGLCFRFVLLYLLGRLLHRLGHDKRVSKLNVHVILEAGHRHAGDAARVFNEVKSDIEKVGCNILQAVTFVGKKEAPPLMVADLLAFGTYRREEAAKGKVKRKAEPESPSVKGTQMTLMWLDAPGLAAMREDMIADIAARRKTRAISASSGAAGS